MLRPAKGKRIATEVAQSLRALILRGQYKAGEKLPPERKLAEDLGVNRATLREALKNLENLGLVRIRQGDGTRVLDFLQTAGLDLLGHMIPLSGDQLAQHPRADLLRDVLELRQIIGREMARLAAGRISAAQLERLRQVAQQLGQSAEEAFLQDLDFYCELSQATGNLCFSLLLNSLRQAVRPFGALFASLNPAAEVVQGHHRALIAALETRQAEEAARIAEQYFVQGCDRFLRESLVDELVGPGNDGQSSPAQPASGGEGLPA